MEEDDEWAWQIAVARARANADDSGLVLDAADVIEEHEEEKEDWEAIIAAARERATEAAPPAPAQAAPVAMPTPVPLGTDPGVPRTVIPVPTLPTSDPERVRNYITSRREAPRSRPQSARLTPAKSS